MSQYRYKLTLEVQDCGSRKFVAEGEFNSQADMELSIPHDIARALKATMICPPSPLALAGPMERDCWSIVAGLVYLYSEWDGEHDFDNCLSVTVDLDMLCGTNEESKNLQAKDFIKLHGINPLLRSGPQRPD